jgi:Mrp family chromosome partitioning ATPase
MRAIAVVNQKGGCGKPTTAVNLAAFLAFEGWRTLVVNMDPQTESRPVSLPLCGRRNVADRSAELEPTPYGGHNSLFVLTHSVSK